MMQWQDTYCTCTRLHAYSGEGRSLWGTPTVSCEECVMHELAVYYTSFPGWGGGETIPAPPPTPYETLVVLPELYNNTCRPCYVSEKAYNCPIQEI